MKSNKTLLLEKSNTYYLENKDGILPLEYLPFINKINIFIGANNSGKSKFMRSLMTNKNFWILDEDEFRTINSSIKEHNRIRRSTQSPSKPLVKNLEIGKHFDILKNNLWFEKFNTNNFELVTQIQNPKFYYIPVLRTAHSLYLQKNDLNKVRYEKMEDDIFLHTLKKNYSPDKNIDIFTGVHLYKEILNTRNSKRETRKRFESFEKFISRNFFDDKNIDIIAEFDKDESRKGNNTKEVISIHIEGEKHTRDLYDSGDGIQALIILMYKIFMAENDSYIFIDEPEINLHPGMQRLFLEQIITNPDLSEKNLTYFLSTHSNHFLDLTLEKDNISIYSFYSKTEKEDKKLIIKNTNAGDNDLLKNIGVQNSSVFMANCSIWVEGISDRIYIRAFLKSYCTFTEKKYPKEDIDFAFFEYAGTNLDHYLFDDMKEDEQEKIISDIKALSLSNRIFLLADSDNAKANSKKGTRLAKLEAEKASNFIPKIIKTHREIENLLPNEVWEEVLIDLCNKSLTSVPEQCKNIKDKIKETLKTTNSNDYSKKYIGEFLNQIRNKVGKFDGKFAINESEYESKTKSTFGTLKNKRRLSETIANKEFSWETLKKSKTIDKLITEIYDFITNQ
ncbi:AAA family ATPase [Chryseobacterium potabilaquae]|uniref:Endonuclease GajA/Old nuclease/RecF-like AAA domain-containing protein n=1 Tax=Chryseobacterium potabilaquae TaxID=2675057 RepID=A0A6N4X767_9FLAO|nr:AAA family ATPase [Chryseobacterium potabilaquae]CAA7196551.1 hypothetical protein CHRY9293_02632 [Chryseobacterium potabilaquae]